MRIPRTQIGRLLLLGVITSIVAAPLWVWLQDAPTPPSAGHGYTIPRSDVLAFSDGEPIQYVMDMWLGGSAIPSELRRQADRCVPAQMATSIIGQEHRGVMLCNTAGLSEAEFATARSLFEVEVDGMHNRYYSEWAWRIGQRLLLLLTAVVALAGAAWTIRWIRRGQSA